MQPPLLLGGLARRNFIQSLSFHSGMVRAILCTSSCAFLTSLQWPSMPNTADFSPLQRVHLYQIQFGVSASCFGEPLRRRRSTGALFTRSVFLESWLLGLDRFAASIGAIHHSKDILIDVHWLNCLACPVFPKIGGKLLSSSS